VQLGRFFVAALTGPKFGALSTLHFFDCEDGAILKQETTVDGLFEIIRARSGRPAPATERLILICRDGRLFGADPKGRVYTGELQTSPKYAVRKSLLKGTYEIPIRRKLRWIPSLDNPSFGVPISGEVDPFALSQNATVFVGGKEVDIQITYLGPLPQ
jgi:hypothetical protein